MSAFDPTPGAPFGHCLTCGTVFAAEEDANEHMNTTLEDAKARGEAPRSHSVRHTNPTRPTRIRRRVMSIVDDALEDAMCEMDRLLEAGDVTEAEIVTALGGTPDFQEAWDNRRADGAA